MLCGGLALETLHVMWWASIGDTSCCVVGYHWRQRLGLGWGRGGKVPVVLWDHFLPCAVSQQHSVTDRPWGKELPILSVLFPISTCLAHRMCPFAVEAVLGLLSTGMSLEEVSSLSHLKPISGQGKDITSCSWWVSSCIGGICTVHPGHLVVENGFFYFWSLMLCLAACRQTVWCPRNHLWHSAIL